MMDTVGSPDLVCSNDKPKSRNLQKLERTTLRTSRLLDFCSEKELIAQTGHQTEAWPLVVLKELVDNALDACEEADVAPEVEIVVDNNGITVKDNGPGIPAETVAGVLDFAVRVSNREAYVSPDRGERGPAPNWDLNQLTFAVPQPHSNACRSTYRKGRGRRGQRRLGHQSSSLFSRTGVPIRDFAGPVPCPERFD